MFFGENIVLRFLYKMWDEVTAPERLESSLNNWFFLREKVYFEFLGESILSSHELKLFFLAIC